MSSQFYRYCSHSVTITLILKLCITYFCCQMMASRAGIEIEFEDTESDLDHDSESESENEDADQLEGDCNGEFTEFLLLINVDSVQFVK